MTTPNIKVKVQKKPTLKLKVLPRFPSKVSATLPLTLDRTGGNYAFGLSVTSLQLSLDPLYKFTLTTTGTSGAATFINNVLNIPQYTGGGGGTPGGSNTQLQYNNSGSFGGITGATSNGTILTLTSPAITTPTGIVATDINFTQTGTGAVARTVSSKLTDFVSAKDFGAVCNGSTDDSAAIQAGLTAGKIVMIPPGLTCKITTVLSITVNGSGIVGGGMLSSTLTSSSTTASMISVAVNATGIILSDFQLTRSVTATAGASGIAFIGETDESVVRNMWITKQWVGLQLSTTNYSFIQNVTCIANLSDGVNISDTSSSGTCQWYIDTLLTTQNVGRGLIVAPSNTRQIALGDWVSIYTFANTSFGVALVGTAGAPIYGLRLSNSFLGGDGNSPLYMDTRGGQHVINNTFLELAGKNATGPTLATGASGVGDGVTVTANNLDVIFTGCYASGNSVNGFNFAGTTFNQLVGSRSISNGGWGAFYADGSKGLCVGNTFSGNSSGTVSATSNLTSLVSTGCSPAINSGQIPGEPTTGNAVAGNIGEYLESVIATGSAVAVASTGVAQNITGMTITLTAGDWDVDAQIVIYDTAATVLHNYDTVSVSSTTGTIDATNGRFSSRYGSASNIQNNVLPATGGITMSIPPHRRSVSGSTQLFATIQCGWSGAGTPTAFGILRARRAR